MTLFFAIHAGQSMWPIQLCITNLPPDIRMDLRYLLLAGIWLGPVKPDMAVVLQPILDRIHALYEEGLPMLTPAGEKVLRAKLLCAVFDLPARAMVLNLIQWNGRYGCTHCLDEGTQRSHVRLYLPSDAHNIRFETDLLNHARRASNDLPVFGVKGQSVLSPYLNIVKDTAIDYMHAVLEGVAKSILIKFWLNGKYKDSRFYLGKEVKNLDKFLLCIRPPHEFRRTPRSIEKTVKYWKASEWRAWLLFYSLPIVFKFLPPDYLHHLNLLVKAIHLLLAKQISSSDISAASTMLDIFYLKALDLYPENFCSMNVHSLIHLPQTVKNFGPLWAYSCFGFENMNGHLKKHTHGTTNVLPQLVRNLRFHQNMLSRQYNKENHQDGVRGRIKQKRLSAEYIQALEDGNYDVSNPAFLVFPRYKQSGILYTTWKNSKQLRNSSECQFTARNGTVMFGSIRCFCFCSHTPVAIIASYGQVEDAFQRVPLSRIHDLNTHSLMKSCIFQVEKLSNANLQAVAISSIINKCIHISTDSELYHFIIPIPNSYEHH